MNAKAVLKNQRRVGLIGNTFLEEERDFSFAFYGDNYGAIIGQFSGKKEPARASVQVLACPA